ncbi:MAG: glycosyltransferase [Pseudomonadota bacterium]
MQSQIKKLNITIIIGSLARGGCETWLSRTMPRLNAKKYHFEILLLNDNAPLESTIKRQNINVTKPWLSFKIWPNFLSKILSLSTICIQIACHYLIKKPDIVHFYLPSAYLIGGFIGFLCRQKNMVMSRRSLNFYQTKTSLPIRSIEIWLHKKMRAIIANSKKTITQLHEEEEVPLKKLHLHYNGLDLPKLNDLNMRQQSRSKLKLEAHQHAMIMIANLIPYKGHLDLLEACAQLSDRDDWRLLLVGATETRYLPYQQRLKNYCQTKNIDDKVWFLGQHLDVWPLCFACDLGLLTSHEEGFSNAILEYMAASIPVIATDVGGNSEAVIHQKTGLIVPPKSPDKLKNAIETILDHQSLKHDMGQAGIAHLRKHFTFKQNVDALEQLYDHLTQQHKV